MRIEPIHVDAINAGLAMHMQAARVPPPLRLSDHADRHFRLSAESSSVEGPWKTLPYQRAIMDAGMANDDVRIVSFRKSARVGYTKMLCAYINYAIEHKRRDIVLYLPTEQDAIDTVRTEIDPMLRDVPRLGRAMKTEPGKRSSANTKHKKQFVGCSLDVLGGKSERNYRRITKDTTIYDELSGFDRDIEGAGRATVLGDKRFETSSFGKSIRGSTPGVAGNCLMEDSLAEAQWVFSRYLPCRACGHMAPLQWAQFVYDDDKPETVRRVCARCEHACTYEDYAAMDARGQWRTNDDVCIDEHDMSFRTLDGDPLVAMPHIGFVIWSAYSYYTDWIRICADWIAANTANKQGDQSALKTFVQQTFGECWTERGIEIDQDWLMARREDYGCEVPQGVEVITAGVDVGKDYLQIEYVGFGIEEESWSIDYQQLVGDTSEAEVWTLLDRALHRTFTRADGVVMGVSGACIDSGYNSEMVYAFCAPRTARCIYPIKGVGGWARPHIGNPSRQFLNGQRGRSVRVYPLGVDPLKRLVFERLENEDIGGGYCHFPIHYGKKYFRGITGERMDEKYRDGRKYYVFKQIVPDNEPLDCRVYATAALRLTQIDLTTQASLLQTTGQVDAPAAPGNSPQHGGGFGDGYLDDIDPDYLA